MEAIDRDKPPLVPGWILEGHSWVRTEVFLDFPAAMRWVNRVALLAEQRNHHPDIEIHWNRVTLRLTTHETGGLTDRDRSWAQAAETELALEASGSQPTNQ